MAFKPPPKLDLLTEISRICLKQRSDHCSNILRRSTIGLKSSVELIDASRKFGEVSSISTPCTDSTGDFLSSSTYPLLDKRYSIEYCLGQGSFSKIFRAIDTLGRRDVAVKIMRVGFDELAAREICFLRRLSTCLRHDRFHYFLELNVSFKFHQHSCLVIDLMDATLYDFLVFPIYLDAKDLSNETDTKGPPIDYPRCQRGPFFSNVQRTINLSNNIYAPSYHASNDLHTGGSLGRMNNLSTAEDLSKFRRIALSLTSCLCILRRENIIHGDVKPENCFLKWGGIDRSRTTINTISPSGSVSGRGGMNGLKATLGKHSRSNEVSEKAKIKHRLEDLPPPGEFEVRLGDFGNSILTSEVPSYYTDFEIQSLPYRAPEVLLGVPFGPQIDVWSLGIVLLELACGEPLFLAQTKQQLFDSICAKLSEPPTMRFAGGKYSDELMSASSISHAADITTGSREAFMSSNSDYSGVSGGATGARKVTFSEHVSAVRKLLMHSLSHLSRHVATQTTNDLVHFLAGLVHPDPDLRLSAFDALQHPFLAPSIAIPSILIDCGTSRQDGGSTAFTKKRGSSALSLANLRSKVVKIDDESLS